MAVGVLFRDMTFQLPGVKTLLGENPATNSSPAKHHHEDHLHHQDSEQGEGLSAEDLEAGHLDRSMERNRPR